MKLAQALTDGDEGATLLRTAFAAVPKSVSALCPEESVALHLDVIVPFLAADAPPEAATDAAAPAPAVAPAPAPAAVDTDGGVTNTRERMAAFFGGSGGGSERVEEWASADRMRQALCTLEHCADLAGRQETLMGQLETKLRAECDGARDELKAAKAKVPAEETKIFDDLREAATR